MKNETKYKIVLGISILIILIMFLYIKGLTSDIEYLRENYIPSCWDDNKKSVCIDKNSEFETYKNGEYLVKIKDDETYAICDTDRKEIARCISEDVALTQCNKDLEYGICVDKDKSYTSCNEGKEAICVKEGVYSVYNGRYSRECNVGETAYCS